MSSRLSGALISVVVFFPLLGPVHAQQSAIPPALEPWQDWVNATIKFRDCPKIFNDHQQAICFWPSRLTLDAEKSGARWRQEVRVFERTWVPIPGDLQLWPREVRVDGKASVVIGRDGRPSVELEVGSHSIEGAFQWKQIPQRLKIPHETGVLQLTVGGEARPMTSWSETGEVWLRRVQGAPASVDRLGVQVYRVIEDGIPVWLRTEIELTVSGKSREEELGWIIPEGWRVASVESPIPVAIDDLGRIKTQVRAGEWSVKINAFSTSNPDQIQYAEGADPVEAEELIGLRPDNTFRVPFIEDLAQIDVTQTTFPERWRGVPVYKWDTSKPLSLQEKQRGMGEKAQGGLSISRELWLDDDGQSFTYEDRVKGEMQEIWRLDAAEGLELGAVRIDGESQLITASPSGNSSGFEVRQRDLDLTAIGRSPLGGSIASTGWQADADSLSLTLTLPPGWRAFAVFGADDVSGDWLTAWSLLDLFLLMIFSLAVLRLYGWIPCMVAMLAFALSYHEYGSPRWSWFCLLVPLALSRVVRSDAGQNWLKRIRLLAAFLLACFLLPFMAHQVQSVLYPQLEVSGVPYGYRDFLTWMGDAPNASFSMNGSFDSAQELGYDSSDRSPNAKVQLAQQGRLKSSANLLFDPKSKIQTGPARPVWSWNRVECSWSGPVTSEDQIQPVLISLGQNRLLTLLRVCLLAILAAFFISNGAWKPIRLGRRSSAAVVSVLMLLFTAGPSYAQNSVISQQEPGAPTIGINSTPESGFTAFPDSALLDDLRERLNKAPSAFPATAEISAVNLELRERQLKMVITYHTAEQVVVPVPGRFPAWSPISIRMENNAEVAMTRREQYLWALMPKGVHQLTVIGEIPDQSDWEWGYLLKPKLVTVDAPGWSVTGLNADGIPGEQLLFSRDQPNNTDTAEYDQTRSDPIVLVDRQLEIGLVSKVRTTVTRIGGSKKAIAMQVPLLPGEAVLTPNREVQNGVISVQLDGGQQKPFEWESEFSYETTIELTATETNQFVERWSLLSSPIWNVSMNGLRPIFERGNAQLVPVWRPWGGEAVRFDVTLPTAIDGESLTITGVDHQVDVGSRQRTTKLQIKLDCSLSTDFVLDIGSESEITGIRMDGNELPRQGDGSQLVIPVSPGKHDLVILWSRNQSLGTKFVGEDLATRIESSNVRSIINMPRNRWVLWASGPLRGPAVRFWVILLIAIMLSLFLGYLPSSPLNRFEWTLLVIGLTQVNLAAAMIVVGWLFALRYRGERDGAELSGLQFNFQQLCLVLLTVIALAVLVFVVANGLLGYPEMFIRGNGSSRWFLNWFTPRAGSSLPAPVVYSISVWFYRVLMLFWALWLASALLRWLATGWSHFTYGGAWRSFSPASKPSIKSEAPVSAIDAELVDPPADGTEP